MTKKIILICGLFASILTGANAFAQNYDFQEGDFYYKINSNGTSVTLTYKDTTNNDYPAIVAIPPVVSNDGVTYDVTTIGKYAFKNCPNLKELTIPEGITSIEFDAFGACPKLYTLNYNAINAFYDALDTNDGKYYSMLASNTSLAVVNIGNKVKVIPQAFLVHCDGVKKIEIPNSVTKIDIGAFGMCYGLEEITVGENVDTIEHYAFDGLTHLKTLRYNAINAFYNSYSQKDDTYYSLLGGQSENLHIIFGNKVQVIPNRIASFSKIKEIVIPNNVKSIEMSAFYNCMELNVVKIGSGIEKIEDRVFMGDTHIDTIYCMAEYAPLVQSETFKDVNKNTFTYVPCGRVDNYKGAEYWSSFNKIQERCDINGFLSDGTQTRPTGIEDVAEQSVISVYPNPASGSVTVEAEGDVFIMNALGQMVKTLNNAKGTQSIDISDLPSGIYTIRCGNTVKKLVVK